MSTAAVPPPEPINEAASPTLLGRIVELTARVGTSWFGLIAGYFAALGAALLAYQKLEEPLNGTPWWVRPLVAVAPLVFVFFGHTIPALIDQRRRKRLNEISGELKPGYFQLSPREHEESFARADNKHEEILQWVKARRAPVLYLTGQSGSGKSSILSAWVVPRLTKQECPVKVIQLRGYHDPLSGVMAKLREPYVIWSRPPDLSDVRQLLERASHKLRPERLLVVFDQFEEFVILHDETRRQAFEHLLASLVQNPIDGLTVLLVLRSDYVGILEQLSLPRLVQDSTWKEVPPFTESAASAFLRGSDLQISEDVLRDVLREAAEIEQTQGLIRPVTLNLCGLVLGRFATGLPRGFRPGRLIRGFLLESVKLPSIREVTPKLLPLFITNNVTKRPCTVSELTRRTGLNESTVIGCLRVLGRHERGIVRSLDPEQTTWEISHDFLVPLLDSIFSRWSSSIWRRVGPYVPWVVAACSLSLTFTVLGSRETSKYAVLEPQLHLYIGGFELTIRNISAVAAESINVDLLAWGYGSPGVSFTQTFSVRDLGPRSDSTVRNIFRPDSSTWFSGKHGHISGYMAVSCRNCSSTRAWAFHMPPSDKWFDRREGINHHSAQSRWILAEFSYPDRKPRIGSCVDVPADICHGHSNWLVWQPARTVFDLFTR